MTGAIADVLSEHGPLTGAELLERTGTEPLALWRSCLTNPEVESRIVGRRYLRLDRAVDGYARLSPSIRREFLTYTLLDRRNSGSRLDERALKLTEDIIKISDYKRRLATQTIASIVDGLPGRDLIKEQCCFILAGDITYGMAHKVPRPEHSTGKMVRGSDLDVIVVSADSMDPGLRAELDDAIYQKKYWLLVSPSYREELDYLIKDMHAVEQQVEFDTFEHMVACKILVEGECLNGSSEIMTDIKRLLAERGIPERLRLLEQNAAVHREHAVSTLREEGAESDGAQYLNLFYTSDESDEIY
jgi:hypothetical protein